MLQAVVTCRSVPRILDLFRTHALLDLDRVPHCTSVINRTLRVGPGLLRQVAAITEPRVAIVDHSIDIGTKKALVVLRVPLAALSRRGAAIHLADCGCVGPTIADTVDGETVARHLEAIFDRSGAPAAITKDCDATLQEGVRLWMEKAQVVVPVIEDMGHVMASALKARFEQTSAYQRFTTPAAEAAKSLRQTEPAFLVPPKLRTKGLFLSIGKLARWGEKMLGVPAVEDRAEKGSLPAKLRAALPGFLRLRAFVETFASTAVTVSRVMETLKHKGLDRGTYEHCSQLAQHLPTNAIVKQRLDAWLSRHIDIHSRLTSLPLVVSSDIVESLFGNCKHILARSPQADMNRTALLIPALCGNPDETTISAALDHASHRDLIDWEKKNIPYTVRKKREAFFAANQSQKPGNS